MQQILTAIGKVKRYLINGGRVIFKYLESRGGVEEPGDIKKCI